MSLHYGSYLQGLQCFVAYLCITGYFVINGPTYIVTKFQISLQSYECPNFDVSDNC